MALFAACALALVLLAGCGDDDEAPGGGATELVVRVDADGPRAPEPAREARVRCDGADDTAGCGAATRLDTGDFAPVPADTVCTQQYGGPQTARVTGTLRGERIDARFSRTDGCEISRWDSVADLLDVAGP
jgi:hypothetical protein